MAAMRKARGPRWKKRKAKAREATRTLIRPGGLWINLGPLLYHYAEVETEISVELSWEEIRPHILKYFTIDEEAVRVAWYTSNPGSMYGVKYNCMFFVATSNDTPVGGKSNPVFPVSAEADSAEHGHSEAGAEHGHGHGHGHSEATGHGHGHS